MSDAPQTTTLDIEDMRCEHGVQSVRKALSGVDGAEPETVEIGHATVRYDADRTGPEALAEAVEEAGYAVGKAAA
ncbi:MAG: copper chaperone [Bacteroidetes bacterium QS_9_68_14]|nr:MAG: copper chaperone [Bacteroidetes bacterium QS_9_68_14]